MSSVYQEMTSDVPYPVEFFNFVVPTEKTTQTVPAKYYQTGYAAKLIRAVLASSGFSVTKKLDQANLVVGGNLFDEKKGLVYCFQRTNHYKETFSLGSKAGYHHLMRALERRVKHMPSFYPETYLLPEEYKQMTEAFPTSKLWIEKPAGGSRGNGISVIDKMPSSTFKRIVVQRYLDDPLLIRGLKFDLRFYVAVTSLVPLRIYLFDNGLVRLATEPYDANHDDISNRSAHLTNFSINKENPNFHATNDISKDGEGNKWSHRPFWPWLKEHGFDPDEIRRKIEDAFVTTIMAAREVFRSDQEDLRSSFELFGFDVMLSREGDVHILEINVSPALGTSSNLDMFIKAPLVKDLFNIALVPHQSKECEMIENIMQERKDPESCAAISISEYEIAQQRLGGFHCIYPTAERVVSHKQYMEKVEPEDEALAKWVSMSDEERKPYLHSLLIHLYKQLDKQEEK